MLSLPILHSNKLHSSVRRVYSSVEVYNTTSTLVATYTEQDFLKEYKIERVGEDSKFFGFGACQKINVKLRDTERQINLTTSNYLRIKISAVSASDLVYIGSYFYITECHRDENTNELSITAYDKLKSASAHYTSELDIDTADCYDDYNIAIKSLLGLSGVQYTCDTKETNMNIFTSQGKANIEGSETLREMLDDIAEATQSIYYINQNNILVFRRISKNGTADLTIGKEDYFTLKSRTNRRLSAICHATELGNNVTASLEESGTTQYIRDNRFWEMEEDIATLVETALALYGGLTINQFSCKWRGDYRLEIGDRIGLVNKDNSISYSYVFSDTITYNGGFEMESQWEYQDDESETESNSSNLGDILKQTYARVDKAEKKIDIVASDVTENQSAISAIRLDTDNIKSSVSKTEKKIDDTITNVNQDIAELTTKVEASISAEDVKIEVKKELQQTGVDKVVTSTGFKFDEQGLTVSKTGSEMTTTITEDGMIVYRDNQAVLTANNTGVDAVNLHATTYLIIGTYSRFEDYGNSRTGCFWIGG